MAAVSPLLKPLGVAAAGIATFEAVAWGVLSLLGLLACQEVYYKSGDTTRESTIYHYLYNEKAITLPFVVLYLVFSVIWLIVSSWLLADFLRNKFRFLTLLSWTTVTFATSILDLVATVMFGLKFGEKQSEVHFDDAIPPLLIMLLSARGFVLWLANVAAAMYLSFAAHNLRAGFYSDEVQPRRPSSDAASFYGGSMGGERDYYSRANLAYQPEPLSAWNIQSPTVGDMKRGPWNFDENSSPAKIPPVVEMRRPLWNSDEKSSLARIPPVADIQRESWKMNGSSSPAPMFPRVAKPVPAPVLPAIPLPTPQPDYSPPLGRPVRHEPNMYEAPLRSALKKPTQLGRTIL